MLPGFPYSAVDPQSRYPCPRFAPPEPLVAGKLYGSLRKIVMATQAEFQAFLGGSHIPLLIKNVGPRSPRILQKLCEISAEFVNAILDGTTEITRPPDSREPYVVKDIPLPPTNKI